MDTVTGSRGACAAARDALSLLNGILESSAAKQVSAQQVVLILDALAGAADPALVARFPAVLSLCAQKDLPLDSQALLGRYWESSPKRRMLEKLLVLSAALFRRMGIAGPRNLDKIAGSLAARHAEEAEAGWVSLPGGRRVGLEEMRACLEGFAPVARPSPPPAAPGAPPARPALDAVPLLARLFSRRQTDLLLKRIRGEAFTKTEREYFSRTVRKKLEAVADPGVQALARQALARPKRGQAAGRPAERPPIEPPGGS